MTTAYRTLAIGHSMSSHTVSVNGWTVRTLEPQNGCSYCVLLGTQQIDFLLLKAKTSDWFVSNSTYYGVQEVTLSQRK